MTVSDREPERPHRGTQDDGSTPQPSLAHFDEWIKRRGVIGIGLVILVAFLVKAFGPIEYGFTVGLILGVILLTGFYLLEFYLRRRP